MKTLVAYFSHTGENYFPDGIRHIDKGNTTIAAELAQQITDGDLYEIAPATRYPENYKECVAQAVAEKQQHARPALKNPVPDLSGYDRIILGYPCWCGTFPMPVATFLESADVTGKELFPFCTNEGSGMGTSEADLKSLVPAADIKKGLAIKGSLAAQAENDLKNWLG